MGRFCLGGSTCRVHGGTLDGDRSKRQPRGNGDAFENAQPWEIVAKLIDVSEIAIFGDNIVTLGS